VGELLKAKPLRWLDHARKNLVEREIQELEVLRTVSEPEFEAPSVNNRRILMRFYFDETLQQKMLMRVIVEEVGDELIIVTLYKTSRSERYIKGEK
jgi:hypothetical protein